MIEHLISHWRGVRTGLLETIDKFAAPELDLRPYASAWPVRELMLHIAHEEHGEFAYGIAQTLAEFPPAYPPEQYPAVESIKTLLEAVHARTLDGLAALDDRALDRVIVTPWGPRYRLGEMLAHILEHEIHHRAELSLILGMLGKHGLDA